VADVVLPIEATPDHLVSISMYSTLGLIGGLLSVAASDGRNRCADAIAELLHAAQRSIPRWQETIDRDDRLVEERATYFLARGSSTASCHEARLLWEEAAKSPAAALTTGGFRHGTQEMLCENVRIVLWVDRHWMRKEDLALAADIGRCAAQVVLIGEGLPPDPDAIVFPIPQSPPGWQFLADIIPMQLCAERLSRTRGVDCDAFRYCPYIIEHNGGLVSSHPG
jgi:glutamine---fructose-6-phosphate transaminase (isomerizing)